MVLSKMCELAGDAACPLFYDIFFELLQDPNPEVLGSLYEEIEVIVQAMTSDSARSFEQKTDRDFVSKFSKQWIRNFKVCNLPGRWRLLQTHFEKTLRLLPQFSQV